MPEIHPIVVFEIAQAIDLDRTEQLLSGAERPSLRHRGRSTAFFQYRPAPLRVSQEGVPIAVGVWHTESVVDILLYDFGAASVAYTIAVEGDLESLKQASALLRDNADIHADARRRIDALLQSLESAAVKPRLASFTEGYVIFGLRSVPGGRDVAEFCEQHTTDIAEILRGDGGALSAEETANATGLRISFGPTDLTVVDWEGAFVIDPDPEDVRAVLEFANVQLLEMRWLDLQMDDAIDRSYELLTPRTGWRAFWPRAASADARQVAELQLESSILLERVASGLNVFGEEYLARIYRLAAGRFQLSEFDESISRKLATIERIHQTLSERATTVRMEALEWVVITLIALEIVLSLVH